MSAIEDLEIISLRLKCLTCLASVYSAVKSSLPLRTHACQKICEGSVSN